MFRGISDPAQHVAASARHEIPRCLLTRAAHVHGARTKVHVGMGVNVADDVEPPAYCEILKCDARGGEVRSIDLNDGPRKGRRAGWVAHEFGLGPIAAPSGYCDIRAADYDGLR